MSAEGERSIDSLVEEALDRIDVPEHAPGFWQRIDRRLADHQAMAPAPASTAPRHPAHRRRFPAAPVLAAAAVVVLLVAVALLVTGEEDRVTVGPSGRTDTGMRSPTSTTDTRAPTSTSPRAAPPGSTEAVLSFLDAMGAGDFAAAATRLGPQSEAYADNVAGSTDAFLRQAEEGLGVWAAADERTTQAIELGEGQVVVVVSGTIDVEGATEHRDAAFPVRYAESAGAWFVEPWAVNPSEQRRVELLAPAPRPGARPPEVERIDEVSVTTPGEGRAWLSIDGRAPTESTVGADRRVIWSLDEPLPPGQHLVTVAFTAADGTFAASAASYVVDG